jgi:hypothetical protein
MVKSFTLTPKEINVLNYNNLDIGKFFDYETMWFNDRITDKEFDIAQKFMSNLGYQVSTRKEMEEDIE